MTELAALKKREKALELEYNRVKQKKELRDKIIAETCNPICDSYTLREIGKILHISHESARQIENKAQRVMKHPIISRKLRDYTKE